MDNPHPHDRRRLTLEADPFLLELLARCSFPPSGEEVTCAVSGGADSLALLALARAAGCSATAVHVDHGLRPGSVAEADVVAENARVLGASFRAETVQVTPGPNLEARARQARLAALPADALFGHTADDRAETMLLNLLRGAGPDGLAAMGPSPRRPILGLRRIETVAVCEHLGLRIVEDPTNALPVFRRNRVRHELLPLLADIADRDPVPVLNRQGALFADIAADLEDRAATIDPSDATTLRVAPLTVARAAVRRWLRDAGVNDGYAPTAAAIERVLSVARGEIRATQVDGGWRVSRRAGRLRLSAPTPPDR